MRLATIEPLQDGLDTKLMFDCQCGFECQLFESEAKKAFEPE
jgi:hypothetical protein